MAENVFQIDELVIHSSKYRNGQPVYQWCGYSENCVEYDASDDPELEARLRNAGLRTSNHHTGFPLFCMHLKINKFTKSVDGYAKCVIEEAGLCSYPGPGGDHIPSGYPVHTFGYGITVFAMLLVDGNIDYSTKTQLFWKPGTAAHDPGWGGRGTWDKNPSYHGTYRQWDGYLTQPLEISVRMPSTGTDHKIDLAIFMYSECTCDQSYQNRVVYATDLTPLFEPEGGYIWRRFGTVQEELALAQKYNYTPPDPNLCNERWHLIRPFFYQPNSSGTRRWKSVEEVSE